MSGVCWKVRKNIENSFPDLVDFVEVPHLAVLCWPIGNALSDIGIF